MCRDTDREEFRTRSREKRGNGKRLRKTWHQRLSWDFQKSPAPGRGPPTSFLFVPLPTDLLLPQGDHPLAAMASLLTTPSPGEELITTPILQATEARSPEAEASTALIAVVITVVFLTLLSVVILIFFYLYKNKGSYVTYEPAEGEPSAILQMESDSAKGREKEEYFI
nr:PREDICTED: small cell adhesion glycoprotein isoform X1 [Equus przewalskii]